MRFVYILLFVVLLFLMCGESDEGIVGSPDHDIRVDSSQELGVIADGVSELLIKAVVTDLSGLPASGKQVYFTSTLGEIQNFAYTSGYGVAQTSIRSVASEQDVVSKITATVLDTSAQLRKPVPLMIQLVVEENEEQSASLRKVQKAHENTTSVDVIFRGVTLELALVDTLVSADGISSTQMDVHLFETNSKLPIAHKIITATCFMGSITGSSYTGTQGTALLNIVSSKEEGVDTVQVSTGNTITQKTELRYVHPKLAISAKESSILADGRSATEITATLLSLKNTPIRGANVYFATSAGIIAEKVVTNENGKAVATLVSAEEEDNNVIVTARFSQLSDSVRVAFVSQGAGDLMISADAEKVWRDGMTPVNFQIQLGSGESIAVNEKIQLSASLGIVPPSVTTDYRGVVSFKYIPDAGSENANVMLTAQWNDKQTNFSINLIGVDIYASVLQDSLPADGTTQTQVDVQLREAGTGVPITGYEIEFGVPSGRIMRNAITDQQGFVRQVYTAGDIAGQVNISIFVGKLVEIKPVYLVDIYPSQIMLTTETNYIWVRETGEIEQTTISAKIVGISGEPINKAYKVAFRIVQGPGGGETLQAPSGIESDEMIVSSNQGLASVKLRSGIKSGAVQIAAELVSLPQIRAQTSQIVIRSGPPYMWISPTDHNDVIQHGTLIVEPGKQNIVFANPVQPISVSAIFTDKYNNPVEQGTAVYFTTTGGLVSSDASTNELGQAGVVLQNANPFPYLYTDDAHQLTATNFPDPNSDGSQLLNVVIPDFERSQILNSINDMGMNDGVATILAVTNGRDQFNQNVKVWVYGHVVYSVGLYRFKVWADKYTLQPGESATISIEVFDANGNPVAAGSSLSVKTDKGKISVESLMNPREIYGWGSTLFSTALINNEDSSETGMETAVVEIELESPNGNAVSTLTFTLIVPVVEN